MKENPANGEVSYLENADPGQESASNDSETAHFLKALDPSRDIWRACVIHSGGPSCR